MKERFFTKTWVIFLITLLVPPVGVFLIVKYKHWKTKDLKAAVIIAFLSLSAFFWFFTIVSIQSAWFNYRRPLTPELNEKHRQTIASLYDEYMDLKENYSLTTLGYPKNSTEIDAWHTKVNDSLLPYEVKEEFSEEHENVHTYFGNLFFNLKFPGGGTKYNVSEEKANLMELYIKAVIDEDREASILKEAIETGNKKINKEESLKSSVFKSTVVLSSVNNDNTGKWKKVLISEDISIKDKALDYYKTYFNNDSEIHAIVNFANNTTTKISVLGTHLDVTTYEYVKGEENDANLMFSGMLLKEYFVDINTGEVEEIQ